MKRLVLPATLVLISAAGWELARACAPDFFRAVFSYVRHPDLPRTEFIDGRLGVLQPTFARSYLVIAYRYLNGIGMNTAEREQARDYFKDRAAGSSGTWHDTDTDWPARWRAVRSRIQSPSPPSTSLVTGGQLAYDPDTHSFALNCAEDAFRIAVHTLEARRRQFGAASAAFRSWVGAQDSVFRNCDRDQADIPQEAAPDLPSLIRADRDYQIAAAHFYAGHYKMALERFRRVGHDASSPWNAISRYLVVRTLLRMTDDPNSAVQAGAQLNDEAQAILSDPKLVSIQGMTWNMVHRANIREKDQAYFRELALLLSAKGQDDGMREELWNYTDLYDHVIGEADPNALFRSAKPGTADVSRFRDPDLTDWISSFQSRDGSVLPHCLERWQQTRSPAWLLAALGHASAAQARAVGLMQAAASIPAASPAYLTARFHLLRFYEELGDRTAARDGSDAVLSSTALNGLPSSVNLFRGLRMLAAPAFDDFLRFASRRPVLVTLQMNVGEEPGFYYEEQIRSRPNPGALLDGDGARILNRKTPFRLLKAAALGGALPPDLRREAILTAFTRGLMLGEDLSEIAKRLGEVDPTVGARANEYLQETSEEGKRFAAAFLLLHQPEARPYFASGISRQTRPGKLDPYRDNWWCPLDIEIDLNSRVNDRWYGSTPNLLQDTVSSHEPAFLDTGASEEAKREMDRLATLYAATDFLGSVVLPFAKSHPADARVPEALYWLVRAGHYGCADVNTWKTTRDAFRVLQSRYAQTTWAKRTPTWFKNDYDIRREIQSRQ